MLFNIKMGVVDALDRESGTIHFKVIMQDEANSAESPSETTITLPGAAPGSTAREVICAVRKDNILCTAFHPELTNDNRWHKYFVTLVKESLRDN